MFNSATGCDTQSWLHKIYDQTQVKFFLIQLDIQPIRIDHLGLTFDLFLNLGLIIAFHAMGPGLK